MNIEPENINLEYKETKTNSFLKTVSAFSNYGGGKIVFGISNNLEIKGIKTKISDFMLSIENSINDNITPMPSYTLEPDYDNMIVTLIVDEGMYKPYFYNSKAYKRSDTSTVVVDNFELKRLILSGQNMNFEDLASDYQNLTFETLKKDFKERKNTKIDINSLKTLNLYTEKYGYNVSASLLADKNSFNIIDIAVLGENNNIFLDRVQLKNMSLIKAFKKTIEIFESNYVYEAVDNISARSVYCKIPKEAFREALLNAIIHRTWDINSFIQIQMEKGKVVITSVGGLVFGMTKEEYLKGGLSLLRNPNIASTFRVLGYIEAFGTGINRIKFLYSKNKFKPKFEVSNTRISITLPILDSENSILKKLNQDEKMVFEHIQNQEKLTSSQISKITGLSKYKVLNLIESLIEKGVLVKNGVGRATSYSLKDVI